MQSLVMVMLLASGASGAIILDNPAPEDPDRSHASLAAYTWPAQRFSIDEATQITGVEAFTWRVRGSDNPSIAIYTDVPERADFTIPGERIFEQEFPVPALDDYSWVSTDVTGATLNPGTYWMAFVTDPDGDYAGPIGYIGEDAEVRRVANHLLVDVLDDEGRVVDQFPRWNSVGFPRDLSVRIHGKAVPEPTATLLLLFGVLLTGLRRRRMS